MKSIPRLPLAVLAAIGAMAAATQAQQGLLFTTHTTEASPQCGAGVSAVSQVLPEEVQYLFPVPGVAPMSMAFAPKVGYCELIGDVDVDSNYWEPNLFGNIDALVNPRGGTPATGIVDLPVDMHSLFFSTRGPVPIGAPIINPCDVVRILPGGVPEFFLTEPQVRLALGIPASVTVNVDAAALAFEPNMQAVFLSLDLDITAGIGPIRDGDILIIHPLTWALSPYDNAALVASVAPNSGMVAYSEASLDAICVASGVSDTTGAAVNAIVDVTGVVWRGLSLTPPVGPVVWFTGIGLRGGSVLSTAGTGQVAILGGLQLGNVVPTPTTGPQVGLLPVVQSLNGLAVVPESCAFVTDTLTPSGPGMLTIEAAGINPGNPTWFLLSLLADSPGGPADPSGPFANPCFPYLYPFMTNIGPLLATPLGCAIVTGGPAPALVGFHITVQAATIDGAGVVRLSTPSVIDL